MLRHAIRSCILVMWGLVFWTGSTARLSAQGCCSGGTPLAANLGLAGGQSRSLQFLLRYDLNLLRHLGTGSERLDDDSRRRRTHSLLFESAYALSDRWSVSLLLSLVRQERRIVLIDEDFRASTGPGDAILMARYKVFDAARFPRLEWLIGGGPKLPTGPVSRRGPDGLLLAPDLQPGTGAWDAILWNYLGINSVALPYLNLNLSMTYRLTTPSDRYQGLQSSYRFGPELVLAGGLSYQFHLGTNKDFANGRNDRNKTDDRNNQNNAPGREVGNLAGGALGLGRQVAVLEPQIGLRYRWAQADAISGLDVANTGGHWLHLLPGLNYQFGKGQAFRLTVDVPVYRMVTGTQLSPTTRITGGYQLSFRLKGS